MAMQMSSESFGVSLVQKQAAQKAMLAKMRSRLAGGSEFEVEAKTRRRILAHKNAFNWGSKLALALILALVNLSYLGIKQESHVKVVVNRALTLPPPKPTLSQEDQALYWTYALYDYALLKTRFGTPGAAVVDAGAAWVNLKHLLPKVDARTRFLIEGYLPPSRKNS